MLRVMIVCSVVLLACSTTVSAVTPSIASRSQRTVPGSPDAAAHTYDLLLSKSRADRIRDFAALPSSTKSAVWAHRLLNALVEHPEFTSVQRAVIQDALSILTPEFFAIERSRPTWTTLVELPLRRLTARANAAFGPAVARELFAELGPPPPPVPIVQDRTVGAGKARLTPVSQSNVINVPPCSCSPESDYCDGSGLGFYSCVQGGCWSTSDGCGTFWRYACTGICKIRNG